MELQLILYKLNDIEKKIDILAERVSKCEKSCGNMDNHISFVENTYSTLRSPLDYFRSTINSITGERNDEVLPHTQLSLGL